MLAGLAAAPAAAALALRAHRSTGAGAEEELRGCTASLAPAGSYFGGRTERLSAGSYVVTMDVLSRYPAPFMVWTKAR